MKDLKTLYELVLSTYLERGHFICIRMDMLKNEGLISPDEFDLLKEHFLTQYPSETMHPEFYNSIYFNQGNSFGKEGAWFMDCKQIRIDLLNKIISTL